MSLQNCSYFNYVGQGLSVEQRTKIANSIKYLKKANGYASIKYWGKILTSGQAYHIIEASKSTTAFEYPVKFFSQDTINWDECAPYTNENVQYLEQIRGLFTGKSDFIYNILEEIVYPDVVEEEIKKPEPVQGEGEDGEDPPEEENEDGEEKKVTVKPTHRLVPITENLRLSFTIDSINNETKVVPRGFHLLNSHQKVIENPSFEGLSVRDSKSTASYVHNRSPIDIPLESTLKGNHFDRSLDFMDSIEEDIPNGCWVLKYIPRTNTIIGKSLLWPGYVFYNVPNSAKHGDFYIGTGDKNVDICFML